MTTIDDIKTLLPLLTRYSMPTDTVKAQKYFEIAESQVNADAPGIIGLDRDKAECYYIAHLMSTQDMSFMLSTEQLGSASASYLGYRHDRSGYYSEYLAIIKKYINGSAVGYVGKRDEEVFE